MYKNESDWIEDEKKAFQLLTVAKFILNRVPMVLGYSTHSSPIHLIDEMTNKLGRSSDTVKIAESEEWRMVKQILELAD